MGVFLSIVFCVLFCCILLEVACVRVVGLYCCYSVVYILWLSCICDYMRCVVGGIPALPPSDDGESLLETGDDCCVALFIIFLVSVLLCFDGFF